MIIINFLRADQQIGQNGTAMVAWADDEVHVCYARCNPNGGGLHRASATRGKSLCKKYHTII